MLCKVRSLGLQGISGYEVTAECDLAGGLPNFDIVGLPDTAVKEARERVRAAIKNSGYAFPVGRITVNPVSYTHLAAPSPSCPRRAPARNLPPSPPRPTQTSPPGRRLRMTRPTAKPYTRKCRRLWPASQTGRCCPPGTQREAC